MTERVIATLRVPADHAIFAGHFPGRPIVPGVMLLDWTLREIGKQLRCETRLLRIRDGKFFVPLLPGELAELGIDDSATRCTYRIRCAETLLAKGAVERLDE